MKRLIVSSLILACFFLTSGFNLDNAIVPKEEILSGGPPKDGIPAILKPKFIQAEQASFLEDKDQVIGVRIGDKAKAYPIARLVARSGILKDSINGNTILIKVNDRGEVVSTRDRSGKPVPHVFAYWFVWQAFHPDTLVYQDEK